MAEGNNAKINFPSLTTVDLTTDYIELRTSAGGTIDAPLLSTVNHQSLGGKLSILAQASGSKVNVPLLGSGPLENVQVIATYDSVINWGAPTSVKNSNISIGRQGFINLAALTNIDSTYLGASDNGTVNIPLVTAYANPAPAQFTASSGGTVVLPALASINPAALPASYFYLTTYDANSLISLPVLTTVSLNGASHIYDASGGARIDLPALATVNFSGGANEELVLYAKTGGTIYAPLLGTKPLTKIDADVWSGTLNWGSPTTVTNSNISIEGTGSVPVAQLTNIDSTTIRILKDANVSFTSLASCSTIATSATLSAGGINATLSFPALTHVTTAATGSTTLTFQASSSGAKTLLPALISVAPKTGMVAFQSISGGTLEANALIFANLSGGGLSITSTSTGSVTRMNALVSINTNGRGIDISASLNGRVDLPSLSLITHAGANDTVSLSATSGGRLNLPSLRSISPTSSSLTLGTGSEAILGRPTSNSIAAFTASVSTGSVSVYLNDTLFTTIPVSTTATYRLNIPATAAPPGTTPVLRFVSTGSASIRQYAIAPTPIWTGAASNCWNTTEANWYDNSRWTNNRTVPFPATFDATTPVPTTTLIVDGNIDVGSITFVTPGWNLQAGKGRLASGKTGTIAINTPAGENTIGALIADGSTFAFGGGTTSLSKSGPGTLILSGPNTYTDGTTLTQGLLAVTNITGSATGTGTVTLNGGTLGGSGIITGFVAGGTGPHTVAPDGKLKLGTLMTNANTFFDFNLEGGDQLILTSSFIFGGGTILPDADAPLGYYKIIQRTGTSAAAFALPAIQGNVVYSLDLTREPGFINVHKGYLGDANDDGTVNFSDFIILSQNFGQSGSWNKANFNSDAVIDFTDFVTLSQNFGQSIGSASLTASEEELALFHTAAQSFFAATGIPEPTTLALLAIGATTLVPRRKRN
jgi:autotransporter-associated beta strand protein